MSPITGIFTRSDLHCLDVLLFFPPCSTLCVNTTSALQSFQPRALPFLFFFYSRSSKFSSLSLRFNPPPSDLPLPQALRQKARRTRKLPLPMRAHSDLSWLHPDGVQTSSATKWLFVGHSVRRIQKFSLQQNETNHLAFIA